jgi:hypothetical protein
MIIRARRQERAAHGRTEGEHTIVPRGPKRRRNAKSATGPYVLFQTRIVSPNFSDTQYAVSPDGRFLINSLPRTLPRSLPW